MVIESREQSLADRLRQLVGQQGGGGAGLGGLLYGGII